MFGFNIDINYIYIIVGILGGFATIITLFISQDFRELIKKIIKSKKTQALIVVLIIFCCGIIFEKKIGAPDIARSETWPPGNGILNNVRERGYLQCGVEGSLQYFSLLEGHINDEDDEIRWSNEASGFDADFCRVIAVAVFGRNYNANSVRFIPLESANRFENISNGRVDVLIRNTTWTVGRDVVSNVEFGPVIFYDGQGFLTENSEIEELEDLNNKSICVTESTTTKDNLSSELAKRNIFPSKIVSKNEKGEPIGDNDGLRSEYNGRRCDVISADKSQLAILQQDIGGRLLEETISKEPLAPAYVAGDEQWRDIVNYSIYATIYASELNISSDNFKSFKEGNDLRIKFFLGIDDQRINMHIAKHLDLESDFVSLIIEQVGSYDDIYTENLKDILPKRGLNEVYSLDNERGLLYSPPFTY